MLKLRPIIYVSLLTAFVLSGCLTPRSIEPLAYYTLDPEITTETGEKTPATLGIRPLSSSRPYNLSMAYQRDDYVLAYRQQDQWAEQPAAVLTRAIRDTLLDANRFADVGMATAMSRPDYILTGEVLKFHEFVQEGENQAELAVRIEIRKAQGVEVLLAETFENIVPIENSQVEANDKDTPENTTEQAGSSREDFTAAMTTAIEAFTTELGQRMASLPIEVE